MASKWCWLLVVLAGCATVGQIKLPVSPPVALTSTEAQQRREAGWKLQAEQPRTLERMRRAAQLLAESARALPDDFEIQCQAAQTFSFIAEYDANLPARCAAAKSGIAFAQQGCRLQPDRVEGHYLYAINVGLLADADRSYGLNAVAEMERALKRATEIDERHDYAGPLRLMGILHLRTPAPPISIGSPRRGLRLLQRAAELFPDYPENQLYFAEALRDNDRREEACVAVNKVIHGPPWSERQFESRGWIDAARKLLPCEPAK